MADDIVTEDHLVDYATWVRDNLIHGNIEICTELRSLYRSQKLADICKHTPEYGKILTNYLDEIFEYGTFEEGLMAFRKKYSGNFIYEPKNDGIDHINVYSKSSTVLGRMLSNFCYSPFTHFKYGKFDSVEGFWYYLSTGMVCEELRRLHGFKAKRLGSTLDKVFMDGFLDAVKEAIDCKLAQNPHISAELVKSVLPITHYYYYGKLDNPKVQLDKDTWLADTISELREKYKCLPCNREFDYKEHMNRYWKNARKDMLSKLSKPT